MAVNFIFRQEAVSQLSTQRGVYILTDLDDVPVYVGKSGEGIRQRVRRHLTSARSDVIANRQIDVWEIGFVWQYPEEDSATRSLLEAALFHRFNVISRLMNGTVPRRPPEEFRIPEPLNRIQVVCQEEIEERKQTQFRLPRQALHYAQLVSHFVSVKNSDQIAGTMDAHFERLRRYHNEMLGSATPEPPPD